MEKRTLNYWGYFLVAIVIQLKHSTTTAVVPAAAVTTAELAYSFVTGDSDGGDRLFIGNASGGVDTIGGKYYTDMMNHPKGSLASSSAIITDATGKIDKLFVDNITIDGNSIDAAGNLTLNPVGGHIDASTSLIKNVVDPVSAQDAATKNYVDQLELINIKADVEVGAISKVIPSDELELAGGWNLNTKRTDLAAGKKVTTNLDSDVVGLASIEIDNVRIDGNTISSTSGNLVLDPTPTGAAGTLIINGNLQVEGTTTTINSTTLTIDDKNIVLAQGAANAAAADSAGISVEGAEAHIFYKSTTDTWNFDKKIIAPNLQINGTISGTYAGFDSDFATKTTTDLSEGTNLYYTTTRADSDFDVRLATKTTDDVTEGSNLYFTGERVDDRVYQLLHAGNGIDLQYLDGTDQLTISTELASTLNPGVATFDSQDFLVIAGNVEINRIDCGTY